MNQPTVDIGILTVREDEFRAVLKAFSDDHGIYKGRHREYTLRTANAGQDAPYRLLCGQIGSHVTTCLPRSPNA